MQRRTFLTLGAGGAALLAVAGSAAWMWQPGWQQGRWSAGAREVLTAWSLAVLDGLWPTAAAARAHALRDHLDRLEASVAGFPPHVQQELGLLLGLLSTAPGRRSLAGLSAPWAQASVSEVQAALEGMRHSRLSLKEQAYQGLRDLVAGVYFSAPQHWAALGYPGPTSFEATP